MSKPIEARNQMAASFLSWCPGKKNGRNAGISNLSMPPSYAGARQAAKHEIFYVENR